MSKDLRNRIKKILSEEIKKQNSIERLDEFAGLGAGFSLVAGGAAAAGVAAVGAVALGALYGLYTAADSVFPYTPAQTTKKVLTPGSGGLVRDFNKTLDEKVKSAYVADGVEFDSSRTFDIETVIPGKRVGLTNKEITTITKSIRDAVETPGLLDVGTDEEGISKALTSCRSKWGVSQVSDYYGRIYGESLFSRLKSELSNDDFIEYVTFPIDSLPLMTIDGTQVTEQEFFSLLESQIRQAEEEEAEEAENDDGSGDEDDGEGKLDRDRLSSEDDEDDDDEGAPYLKRPLTDIQVLLSDVPFNQKTYRLDDVFGEGASLELAKKLYDSFTDAALINGVRTRKLNFAIKFKNGKAKSGKVQLRGRKGLQGVFASQTNVKAQIVRWFKKNKRKAKIKEFRKLDGIVRGSVYIPGGIY
tara:strand:+ start:1102 stop:2346 length:1245 start_codon:yes stop_codon:yes gene_type:complete